MTGALYTHPESVGVLPSGTLPSGVGGGVVGFVVGVVPVDVEVEAGPASSVVVGSLLEQAMYAPAAKGTMRPTRAKRKGDFIAR